MAVRAVQIDKAEYDKGDHDDPNLVATTAYVDGIGDIDTYWRKEHVDDLTSEPTKGTETYKFAAPVEVKDEDEEGEEYTYYRLQGFEIDLSKASLTKLLKALAPFVEAGREFHPPTPQPAFPQGRATANPKLTEWNRRAKAWLRDAGHDVKERGRIPLSFEEIYVKNHPDDPKPE